MARECSDLDFVAVLDGDLTGGEVRRLRALHLVGHAPTALRSLIRAQGTFRQR